jgi:hypothetical protein
MLRPTVKWSWLGTIVLFFAWGFVMHGVGLVLHEVGGHGVADMIFGCGIERIDLTYFAGGATYGGRGCVRWFRTLLIIDWAGLAVTISAGAVAMAFQRRAGLTPLTRFLLALLATGFLLGQLAYVTSGGFHDVGDPQFTSIILRSRGLHVLAWLPALVLFAAVALYGGCAIVDAFREHFGSRSRLHTLKQITATLGTAGLLYFVAFRIESAIRTDMIRGVAFVAEQRAADFHQAPPFPIHRVLIAIVIAAFIVALVRPVRRREGAEDAAPGRIPRRHAVGVAVAALGCAIAITVLMRVRCPAPAPPALSAPPQPPPVLAPKGP